MNDRLEPLRFLSVSPHRVSILRALDEGGEMKRCELETHVDASRRTIKRALDAFRRRGWIRDTADGISLSIGGAFILDAYEDFEDRLKLVDDLRPFFSRLRKGDCQATPAAFEDATVVEMDAAYPFATVEYVLQRYREATERAHVLLSYVSIGILERIAAVGKDEDIDHTVILDGDVREAIRTTTEYHDFFADRSSTIDLYTIDESFPLTLVLIDDDAILTVTNDDGLPTVLLRSSNPTFLDTIETRFESAFEGAEPF
ncbi:MAG: helix-turn-helix transcriptional regulator [Halanaeroarchaeum sp.]